MTVVNTLMTLFGAVVPVFGLMGAGFGMRRVRWLTAEADQSLLHICVKVLLPSLFFESVLGNEALRRPENLWLPPLVGVVTVLASIGLAWLVTGFTKLESPGERRTFALTTGLQNYGYIPLPLCILLFDPGTVGVLLVLFYLNWRLALLSLIPIPFVVLAMRGFARYVRPAFRLRQKELGNLNAILSDNLSGIRDIKAFTREEEESRRFNDRVDAYRFLSLRAAVKLATTFIRQ